MGCDQKWSKQSRPGLSDQSFISCRNPLPTQLLRYFAELAVPNCRSKIKNPEKSFASPVDDALNQRQERQAMTTFKATTEGADKLGLRRAGAFANDQWLPDHYTEPQRVGIVFDQFKRQVEQELKLLVLEVDED